MTILTVVTPAAQELVTQAAVKTDLNLTTTDSDSWIAAKIVQVCSAMATQCKRSFIKQSYSELWRQSSRLSSCASLSAMRSLRLSNWPFDNVTVTEDGTLIDEALYEADADSGILYRLNDGGDRIRWTAGKIVLTYDAGYDAPEADPPPQPEDARPLPGDLVLCALECMKEIYFARNRDPALRSRTESGAVEEYWIGAAGNPPFGPRAMDILSRYKALDDLA